MDFKTSLKDHNIHPNGVIHVGANIGEMAPYYHKEGIHKVMWIDKDHGKYKELYQATAPYGMHQLYFTAELYNAEEVGGKTTFKHLWRTHSAKIDIETYDFLCMDIKADTRHVLDGFEDFLGLMKHVAVRPGSEAWVEDTLSHAGFTKAIQTDTVIIYEGKRK